MPYLELPDGVPLYFEDHGEGRPIALVSGWTITTRFWERQVADLARDHRVVAIDLRGAGNSGVASCFLPASLPVSVLGAGGRGVDFFPAS